jgi:hypothetical protein
LGQVELGIQGDCFDPVAAVASALNAEIRGRKIGDTFPDQSSIFPVFFPGSSGRLSLVFPLI